MDRSQKYKRSPKGHVSKIFNNQKTTSAKRGHPAPPYTRDELLDWVLNQPNFEKLYSDWVASGYDRNKAPSVDRLDDYKPYSFDNIRLVSWGENARKAFKDCREGRNNKRNTAVLQYSQAGEFLGEFHSAMEAGRTVGTKASHILNCCKGKHAHIAGFVWKYKEPQHEQH